MSKIIRNFIFNQKVEYLFWGVMTTLVYFVARFASMLTTDNVMIPVAIAQVISIIFAFVVNKYLVFNGQQSRKVTTQFVIFIIGRAFAAALDFLFTDLMMERFRQVVIRVLFLNQINYHEWLFSNPITRQLIGTPVRLNAFICVIFIQVMIIVINFIVSKYFAFK